MALANTRARYMRRVLRDLGVTIAKVGRTHRRECVTALLGQSNAESGSEPCNGQPGQGARNNPLNTTYDLKPNTDYNTAHVRNYPTFEQGIRATSDTYRLSYYVEVRALMLNPKSTAVAIAAAIDASPWGTRAAEEATKILVANPAARRRTARLRVG